MDGMDRLGLFDSRFSTLFCTLDKPPSRVSEGGREGGRNPSPASHEAVAAPPNPPKRDETEERDSRMRKDSSHSSNPPTSHPHTSNTPCLTPTLTPALPHSDTASPDTTSHSASQPSTNHADASLPNPRRSRQAQAQEERHTDTCLTCIIIVGCNLHRSLSIPSLSSFPERVSECLTGARSLGWTG
jgi:hypothetical protein